VGVLIPVGQPWPDWLTAANDYNTSDSPQLRSSTVVSKSWGDSSQHEAHAASAVESPPPPLANSSTPVEPCAAWEHAFQAPSAADRTDPSAPFWLLRSAPEPELHVRVRPGASFLALGVPTAPPPRVWHAAANSWQAFTGDYAAGFPIVPGALPDDLLVHIEDAETGAIVSLRPVLCVEPLPSSGGRLYSVPLDAAFARLSAAVSGPEGRAAHAAPLATYSVSGLVLLRSWAWNCAPPGCPDSGKDYQTVHAIAEDVRTALPRLTLSVESSLPLPTGTGTGAGAPGTPAPVLPPPSPRCDSAEVALTWRRASTGPGGCGLACDERGLALGPPSCTPIRAPDIQSLFVRIGYPGGLMLLGDSNSRRAFRTLNGLLSAAGPGTPFSPYCAADRASFDCACGDNHQDWAALAATPPFNLQFHSYPLDFSTYPLQSLGEDIARLHWTPDVLPVVSFGNWEVAFHPLADFLAGLPRIAAAFSAVFAASRHVVFRPASFTTGHDNSTQRLFNSGNSRVAYEASVSAMRAAFGERLIVWDVFALNEARPPHLTFDPYFSRQCFSHVPSEIVTAEVQALLWQLRQLPDAVAPPTTPLPPPPPPPAAAAAEKKSSKKSKGKSRKLREQVGQQW
jgi:hypothetical protein